MRYSQLQHPGVERFFVLSIDFLLGILVFLCLFKLHYPTDLRRMALGVLAACIFLSPFAKRHLFFSRLLRSLVYLLMTRDRLRRGMLWLFMGFLMLSGSLRALALQYELFDTGIYHQLLWNLAYGNGFLSSISQTHGFLTDHLVPSLVALVPAYWLALGNPWVLGVLPGILIGACLAALFGSWFFLAERFPKSSVRNSRGEGIGLSRSPVRVGSRRKAWVSSVLVLAAWGFQPFWGNLSWGFHENLWGAVLLSWALALYLTNSRFVWVVGLLIFAAGAKETYLLVVAFTSLALLAIELLGGPSGLNSGLDPRLNLGSSRTRKVILSLLSLSCVVIFVIYSQSNRDPHKNYFIRYFGYLGSDLPSVLHSLFLNPLNVLKQILWKEAFIYGLAIVMPFGFIPLLFGKKLFSNRISWLLLAAVPSVGLAILSSYHGLRDPNMHYFFEVVPILGILTVSFFLRVPSKRLVPVGFLWLLVSWASLESQPLSELRYYLTSIHKQYKIFSVLNQIPAGKSIMAEGPVGSWVAGRKSAAVWGHLSSLDQQCPDFYIMRVKSPADLSEKLKDMDHMNQNCLGGSSRSYRKTAEEDALWVYSNLSSE